MAAPVLTSTEHFIAGDRVVGTGERIEVVNPATEQVIATIPAGTAAEADAAVEAAAAAFPAWAATPVELRAEVVGRIADGLKARAEELAATITAEVGTPITFASRVQVPNPIAIATGVVRAVADGVLADQQVGNSLVVREPIGVVAAITPWNFPVQQIIAKLAPALVAGCTVVLKPSEVAPLNAGVLTEVLAAAGVPSGVVNLVHGTGPVVGEVLASHPKVDMVSFTGSTRAGRRVSALAAATVKRVSLELGGKSAHVVLADADLAKAVKLTVGNSFMNNGQACSAWTRLLVPSSRHEEAVALAAAAAEKYVPGDPTSPATRLGPLVSATQRERVLAHIRAGIEQGARLACGGPEPVDGLDLGYYVRPTVFGGVRQDMTIANEEIFGPVLSVLPYETEDEAVEIANATIYGLAGGVFSADEDRALAVARRLRTGQVDLNGAAFNVLAPFGGYRQSGNGREFGRFGVEEFCELKAIQR
ncbi:aldehyde dehydrogenase family protein [Kutzneria albida]|uniref:aldehyde dehydrogenase (NAD(+)) n=1 Tax=Kutzneria albida DSM 43870 TaxID=1449976 RepID=W5W274_9PSEU|nr:aldehyde dehydrogenase family protein [Kutzneria albida]AHH94905.1 putative aldehyde dehydrogenase [Kutzneria albida DSM 43870]